LSLKGFFSKVDAFFNVFDVRSYGYKVNRWVTNGSFLLLLLLLFFVVQVDGVGSLVGDSWVECVGPESCVNPFYVEPVGEPYVLDNLVDCDVFACDREFLVAGEVLGYKPSWLARNFVYFSLFFIFGGLLLNHFLYNRGYFKDEKSLSGRDLLKRKEKLFNLLYLLEISICLVVAFVLGYEGYDVLCLASMMVVAFLFAEYHIVYPKRFGGLDDEK